jgi:hypothetical protein
VETVDNLPFGYEHVMHNHFCGQIARPATYPQIHTPYYYVYYFLKNLYP